MATERRRLGGFPNWHRISVFWHRNPVPERMGEERG